jgi:hypothetical protein
MTAVERAMARPQGAPGLGRRRGLEALQPIRPDLE